MSELSEMNLSRILYVDDIKYNLVLFKYMFNEKFNITCETDPLRALELLKNNQFEIVISDYEMPKMNGMEFLEIVKNEYPEIIRMMLTSYNDYELELEVKRRCDCEFLTKPINRREIENVLRSKILV